MRSRSGCVLWIDLRLVPVNSEFAADDDADQGGAGRGMRGGAHGAGAAPHPAGIERATVLSLGVAAPAGVAVVSGDAPGGRAGSRRTDHVVEAGARRNGAVARDALVLRDED